MTVRAGIFPTFFISGFECSTFVWKDQGRRDLTAETHHREKAVEDYRLLADLGIAVSREGVPWPFVDKAGQYDFSMMDGVIQAMEDAKMLAIWDLCHYGYPDDLDPYSDEFTTRFANYCRAATEYLIPRTRGPHYFTPINEMTFFAYMAGEWAWAAPFKRTPDDRHCLRDSLAKAAIAGVKAIREIDPNARMVNIDPLIQVVPPRDRPDLAGEARDMTFEDTFYAWDTLYGKRHPEYGGSPEILDIVGTNCYAFGQMEYREHGPNAPLEPNDDRIVPLCDLLLHTWERYHRPMIIGETSGLGDGRPAWLKDVMEESLAAVNKGVDLQGICLFPAVDMPDWHTGEWLRMGICDMHPRGEELHREPFKPYVDELRRWQKLLNRVTRLDEDPYSDPVDLNDIIRAAKELNPRPDKDWS